MPVQAPYSTGPLLELPVNSEFFAYSFVTTLDNFVYTFDFRFNPRMNKWLMSILDVDENPLVYGIPLIFGINLVRNFVGENVPRGTLFIFDSTGNKSDPGADDLGATHKLLYTPAT